MKCNSTAERNAQMKIALELIKEACESDMGLCCECPFELYCIRFCDET